MTITVQTPPISERYTDKDFSVHLVLDYAGDGQLYIETRSRYQLRGRRTESLGHLDTWTLASVDDVELYETLVELVTPHAQVLVDHHTTYWDGRVNRGLARGHESHAAYAAIAEEVDDFVRFGIDLDGDDDPLPIAERCEANETAVRELLDGDEYSDRIEIDFSEGTYDMVLVFHDRDGDVAHRECLDDGYVERDVSHLLVRANWARAAGIAVLDELDAQDAEADEGETVTA